MSTKVIVLVACWIAGRDILPRYRHRNRRSARTESRLEIVVRGFPSGQSIDQIVFRMPGPFFKRDLFDIMIG